MRILHFSDVHIGVESYGRTDPETGLSTRLLDFLETFDDVVAYAIDNRVDLALFCGDAYKNRDPTQTHQREFAKRIARLASEGIPVFLVAGNHDVPQIVSRASSLEIYRTLDVPNVYTGDTLSTHLVPTADGPLQIVALPWIRRSGFLARDDTRGKTADEVNKAIEERLTEAIRVEAGGLDESVPAIFAGHVTVGQAKTGSEQSMMLGRDYVLLRSAVALPQFDYVALGHVHRHQVLGSSPLVVYSGSLQRVDFGEENDDKGFCLIDLDPQASPGTRLRDFEFHTLDARRFITVSVEVPRGDLDPTGTVVKEIEKSYVDDAIVRVLIRLPGDLLPHLREGHIRDALSSAHFIASISKEVTDEHRTRLGRDFTKVLEPREVLKVYLEGRGVPTDRARVLMDRAEDLIREEPTEE